jgi:hypothetical protein
VPLEQSNFVYVLGLSGVESRVANTIENVCENMLTHVHEVVHMVVGTFEQGWKKWRSRGIDRRW